MYTSKSSEKVWLNFKSLFTIFQGILIFILSFTANSVEMRIMDTVHKKNGRLHIYVRQDKYKGELIDYLPYSLESKNLEPIYEEMSGWDDDITEIKDMENLPKTFLNYISFIQDWVGVEIKIVSVGPDRKQTIIV